MTKQEFIGRVVARTGEPKKSVEKILGGILDELKAAIAEEEPVTFVGFGTFSVVERAAREGRNPSTGKPISIPACKVPKFKPSKVLKDLIAG